MSERQLGAIGLEPQGQNAPGFEDQITDPDAQDQEGVEEPEVEDDGQEPQEGEASFYDASQVPPELQPTFREMQKAFTQKTQSLADYRRELDKHMQGNALQQQKSVVFDQLMQDQRVRDFLHELDRAPAAGSEDLSDADPMLAQAIERATAPLRQRLDQLQGHMSQQATFAGFMRSHPDWEQHQDGMMQAWEQDRLAGRPNRPPEDAYNWAVVKAGRVVPTRRAPQPGKAVERGGFNKRVAPSAPDLSGNRKDAFQSAVNWALDQHGIDRKALPSLKAGTPSMR